MHAKRMNGHAGMGNRLWQGLVAAVAVAMLVVMLPASPSSAGLETICSGTAEDVTVPSDLIVRADDSCVLQGTTVQGDVDVRAGGNLILEDGATVEGELLVRVDAYAEALDSSVAGETLLRQGWGAYTEGADLADVDVRNSGFFYGVDTDQAGHFSRNSETHLESGWVAGDVNTADDLLTDLENTVVTGRLEVRSAELGSVVCASEVDDLALFQGNDETVQVGGGPAGECATNVFGADLSVQDNTTDEGTHIADNVIRGDLACGGNDPVPAGEDNRVRGEATGQCVDLEPAAPSFTAVEPEDRSADVLARIDERSDQARNAAIEAGPANIGQ